MEAAPRGPCPASPMRHPQPEELPLALDDDPPAPARLCPELAPVCPDDELPALLPPLLAEPPLDA